MIERSVCKQASDKQTVGSQEWHWMPQLSIMLSTDETHHSIVRSRKHCVLSLRDGTSPMMLFPPEYR